MFDRKELEWIKELVEDRIQEMKNKGDYDIYEYDKEIFENILTKIENSKEMNK